MERKSGVEVRSTIARVRVGVFLLLPFSAIVRTRFIKWPETSKTSSECGVHRTKKRERERHERKKRSGEREMVSSASCIHSVLSLSFSFLQSTLRLKKKTSKGHLSLKVGIRTLPQWLLPRNGRCSRSFQS